MTKALINIESAYKHVGNMGEAAGDSLRALWNTGSYVAEFVNNGGAAGTDETFAEFAKRFADGQERKMGGDKITEGSRTQYKDTIKLMSDPKVYPKLKEIAARTDDFCTAVEPAARGNRRFVAIAKALASAVRKGKLGGELTVMVKDSKGKDVPTFNPVLFSEKFPAKAGAKELSPADQLKADRATWVESSLALQAAGLFSPEMIVQLCAVAQSIGESVLYVKPIVPETPKAVEAPAAPAIDMELFAQFQKFQAMMAAK
jgi:hypothetical protein